MARFYVAVLERSADGFGVHFPDVPGCTSHGVTEHLAVRNAEQALHGHLTVGLDHGEEPPAARSLDDVPADLKSPQVARVLIRFDAPEKAVRVNVSLPEDLVRQIDSYAQTHGMTRSGMLAQAAPEQIKAD